MVKASCSVPVCASADGGQSIGCYVKYPRDWHSKIHHSKTIFANNNTTVSHPGSATATFTSGTRHESSAPGTTLTQCPGRESGNRFVYIRKTASSPRISKLPARKQCWATVAGELPWTQCKPPNPALALSQNAFGRA